MSLHLIPEDVFIDILLFLTAPDILCLEITGKDHIVLWEGYAYRNWWNAEFWNKAAQRPHHASRPLGSWKKEVIRLWTFEYYLGQPWSKEEYYQFWKARDNQK
ncbi:MAG: hypothetical protein CMM25_08750 [Rhodospirillaceae bacterium]|nr:hypothetical protein [Rhodospirillaceae bacterium]